MLPVVDWWQTLQVYVTCVVEVSAYIHGSELMIACVGHDLRFVYL